MIIQNDGDTTINSRLSCAVLCVSVKQFDSLHAELFLPADRRIFYPHSDIVYTSIQCLCLVGLTYFPYGHFDELLNDSSICF